MSHSPHLSREAFDELIREHQLLIDLANELEFHVHGLGGQEPSPPSSACVTACQQAAGNLIGQLRQTLFRFDQQVYPLLEPGPPPR